MRRDVAVTVGVRALLVGSGLVASVVTAHYLGSRGRGEYFVVVTLVAGIVQFGNLGLQGSQTYQVARDESLSRAVVANTLWISLLVGIVGGGLAVAVLGLAHALPNVPTSRLWLAAAIAPSALFFLLGTNVLVGLRRIRTFNVLEAVGHGLVLILLLGAGMLAFGVSGFLAASALAWALASSLLLFVLVRIAGWRSRFDWGVFRDGFRYAAKTYVIAGLGFLVLRSNVFLLTRIKGTTDVGYFSVAAQIADALAILPTSAALVLFPSLVRDRTTRFASSLRACAATMGLLVVATVVVGLLVEPLLGLLYPPRFAAAAPMLRWMLPGVVAAGGAAVLSQYLAAIGLPRTLVAVWGLALASVVTLGAILIPSHGGSGAGASLSITYVAVLALVLVLALGHRRRERAMPADATMKDAEPAAPPDPAWPALDRSE